MRWKGERDSRGIVGIPLKADFFAINYYGADKVV